jgi:hypothetical protein
MSQTRVRVLKAISLFCLMLAAGAGLTGQTKPSAAPSGNLYQAVISHRDAIAWRPVVKPGVPADVCTLLQTCTGKGDPKFYTLPPASIDGRQVGRAIFWTHTKDKDAFILEHQTHSAAYFFLLSSDGNFDKAVYLEQGKPFVVIANQLAQPTFTRDKKDWLDWASKIGTAAPKEHDDQ